VLGLCHAIDTSYHTPPLRDGVNAMGGRSTDIKGIRVDPANSHLAMGRLFRDHGVGDGKHHVVKETTSDNTANSDHQQTTVEQIAARRYRRAYNTMIGVGRAFRDIDASAQRSRANVVENVRHARRQARERHEQALAEIEENRLAAEAEITDRVRTGRTNTVSNAEIMAIAQGFSGLAHLREYVRAHTPDSDAVADLLAGIAIDDRSGSANPHGEDNEQQGSHGEYTGRDGDRVCGCVRSLGYRKVFPTPYHQVFQFKTRPVSGLKSVLAYPGLSPAPASINYNLTGGGGSLTTPVGLWALRKAARFIHTSGKDLALLYLSPTALGYPMLIEVLVVAPVWEEIVKVGWHYMFGLQSPGAVFGVIEFVVSMFNCSSWWSAVPHFFARRAALTMHEHTDQFGVTWRSLPRRIVHHATHNLLAVGVHVSGAMATFWVKDMFMGGAMRWNNVVNRGANRRGQHVDVNHPQPLVPPPDDARDPNDSDSEATDGITIDDANEQLERQVRNAQLRVEVIRANEAHDEFAEAAPERQAKRDRAQRVERRERGAQDAANVRGFRLYLKEYDVVRLYNQVQRAIVPFACTAEAAQALSLGFYVWEDVYVSADQVDWVREKLRCLPASRNLLSSAEFWARHLDVHDRNVARIAVQQHLFALKRDQQTGVDVGTVQIGRLNDPAHLATGAVGTYNDRWILSTAVCLCLLNAFAGWDQGRNTLAAQAWSMWNSARTRLGFIRGAIAQYLAVVYAIRLW